MKYPASAYGYRIGVPDGSPVGVHSRHVWLGAVVPSDARRFRVLDGALAATLADAGADLVDSRPDVEIAPAAALVGDALCGITALEAAPPHSRHRIGRAVGRLVAYQRLRRETARARSGVERLYARAIVVPWEVRHRVHVPGTERPGVRGGLADRFPLAAVVVGGAAASTVLQEAARAAAVRPVAAPLARSGTLVVPGEAEVLRIAVGPGRRHLVRQDAALAALLASSPEEFVVSKLPLRLGKGVTGVAEWRVERLLPGVPAPPIPGGRLLDDCVEFLVALHFLGTGSAADPVSPAANAEVVAVECAGADARAVIEVGRRTEEELAAVPCGFAHGDFFSGNLLVEGGRLRGVVDWVQAGAGRLPALDLFNLVLGGRCMVTGQPFAPAFVEHLLPRVRSGRDRLMAAYWRKVGLDRTLLEALAVAYWLEYLAYQLVLFQDRDAAWVRQNVRPVLAALREGPSLGKGGFRRVASSRRRPGSRRAETNRGESGSAESP
jgi:hypothetical protein